MSQAECTKGDRAFQAPLWYPKVLTFLYLPADMPTYRPVSIAACPRLASGHFSPCADTNAPAYPLLVDTQVSRSFPSAWLPRTPLSEDPALLVISPPHPSPKSVPGCGQIAFPKVCAGL